ncbi:hypothetical protein D3C83_216620 [compost metagenome]
MAANKMLYAPPAHAAVAVTLGPRVRRTLTRFADTVEAMILGITVGLIRLVSWVRSRRSWISW